MENWFVKDFVLIGLIGGLNNLIFKIILFQFSSNLLGQKTKIINNVDEGKGPKITKPESMVFEQTPLTPGPHSL